MLNDNQVPAIVQSVQVEQTASWQALISEIAKIDVQETQGALRMGDLFVQIEQEYGPKHLKTAAKQAGVSWSVAHQRTWVSKKIAKDSPIRKMKSLTFGHLRALAATENPEEWAQKVEKEELTVRDLIEAIDQAGDKRQVDKGFAKCAACDSEIEAENKQYVAVSLAGGKRNLCCDVECAVDFLQSAQAEAKDGTSDPFAGVTSSDGATPPAPPSGRTSAQAPAPSDPWSDI